MSRLAIRLSMPAAAFRSSCHVSAALAIGAVALVVVPTVTPASAETGRNHMHIKKHHRNWNHYGAAWPVGPARPVVGSYSASEPVCPTIGKSFDCKIWPPPFADDPDRKTSRY